MFILVFISSRSLDCAALKIIFTSSPVSTAWEMKRNKIALFSFCWSFAPAREKCFSSFRFKFQLSTRKFYIAESCTSSLVLPSSPIIWPIQAPEEVSLSLQLCPSRSKHFTSICFGEKASTKAAINYFFLFFCCSLFHAQQSSLVVPLMLRKAEMAKIKETERWGNSRHFSSLACFAASRLTDDELKAKNFCLLRDDKNP